jgi:hypothetical protein
LTPAWQVQISNVNRKPETYEDRVHNCHNVIEALGGIAIDAEQVCQGDFNAIATLITVFNDLCPPESRSASETAQEWERSAGGRTGRAEQPGQHVRQKWRPWSGEDAPDGPAEPIDQGVAAYPPRHATPLVM